MAVVTIITKNNDGAGVVPSPGSLVEGELAVNTTDRKLYTLNNAGAVVLLASGTSYSDPVVIDVSSASPAVRITQRGSGNALLVEDSTNPDSTPFVINAAGDVINGYTTLVGTQNYGGSAVFPKYQQHGISQDTTSIAAFNWGTSLASPANLILNKSISGTIGTRGALTAANTDIGSVTFNGDDGTNFIPAAAILAEVDGTPGTNDMPGRLVFSTTADGAATPTERMRIDSSGNVGIGTTSPTKKLELAGDAKFITTSGIGLQLHNNSSNQSYLQFTNTVTGETITSGFQVGIDADEEGLIWHYRNEPIKFATNNTERMRIDSAGNINIATAGARITGDFSNATLANRVVFQTSTVNSSTVVTSIPNGTGTTGGFFGYNNSDPTNASFASVQANSGDVRYQSGIIGTGTYLPMTFFTGGSERMRLDTVGNVLVGGTASRGTTVGTAHLDLFNGTAPAGTLTNGISLYSSSGDFSFMDSAGNGYRVGFRNVPAVGTKTGSYILAVADVGKYVQVGSGGSITIPDATFAEGDVISIFNNTSGNITLTCSITTAYISGVDTDRATMTLATRGIATVFFISGTVCVVTGNVS